MQELQIRLFKFLFSLQCPQGLVTLFCTTKVDGLGAHLSHVSYIWLRPISPEKVAVLSNGRN
jgi:hypothetical protein